MPLILKMHVVEHDGQPGRVAEAEGLPGDNFFQLLDEAIMVAKTLEVGISYTFNDVLIIVWPKDYTDEQKAIEYQHYCVFADQRQRRQGD